MSVISPWDRVYRRMERVYPRMQGPMSERKAESRAVWNEVDSHHRRAVHDPSIAAAEVAAAEVKVSEFESRHPVEILCGCRRHRAARKENA